MLKDATFSNIPIPYLDFDRFPHSTAFFAQTSLMEFAAATGAIAQKHSDNSNENVENVNEYWNVFNVKRNNIDAEITKLLQSEFIQPVSAEDATKYNKTIDAIKMSLVSLQKFSSECTRLLPAYDVKRSQEEIEKFNKSVKQVILRLKPEKKFSFSSKKKDVKKDYDTLSSSSTLSSIACKSSVTVIAADLEKKVKIVDMGSHMISNKINDSNITLSSSDVMALCDNKTDLHLQLLIKDCSNCTISVAHIIGNVRLENLKKCIVLLGPICTSCYLENCVDCLFFIACHQLRIHNSHNSNLYVRVNSHPIIEDCSSLGFAYYNICYDNIAAHLSKSNLANSHNYDNVVDFRWHKSTASPNWHVCSEPIAIPQQLQAVWSVTAAPADLTLGAEAATLSIRNGDDDGDEV